MFFFKHKKIVVDCFTTKESAYKYSPIIPAPVAMPQWIREMQSEYKSKGFIPSPTMKRCPAIISMLTKGFVMPMWTDLIIDINQQQRQFRWMFADGETNAGEHSPEQWMAFVDPAQYAHFKVVSPWRFKTKKDINFMWTQPFYHDQLNVNYHLAPAIIEYKDQHSTHLNMFLDLSTKEIMIKAKTPMVQIIPMTDKKVEIKNHLVDQKEYDKLDIPGMFFINNYKKIKKP